MTSATTWGLILAVTLGFHGSALAMMYVWSVIPEGGLGATQPKRPELAQAELAPTCTGDAMLTVSARTAMCLAPWHDDADDCFYDAQMSLWMDLSSCQARNEPSATTVGLVEQKQLNKIKPIDPEPLLEMMQHQPPPPPQPQPQQVAQQQPPPPPPQPQHQMQVVETAKPNTEESPDNARLLSEYDTKVDKEHVNRGARNEPMVAKAKPEDLTPTKEPKNEPMREGDRSRSPARQGRARARRAGHAVDAASRHAAARRGRAGAEGARAAGRQGRPRVDRRRQPAARRRRHRAGAQGSRRAAARRGRRRRRSTAGAEADRRATAARRRRRLGRSPRRRRQRRRDRAQREAVGVRELLQPGSSARSRR